MKNNYVAPIITNLRSRNIIGFVLLIYKYNIYEGLQNIITDIHTGINVTVQLHTTDLMLHLNVVDFG